MPALLPRVERRPLNYATVFLLIAAVVPFVLVLQLDKTVYPWGGALTLGMFALSAVMLISYIFVSLRADNPLLDLSLFKNRVFMTANISSFFLGASFLGLLIFLPLFVVNVLGVTATKAGVSLIPLSLGLVFGAIVSGQLVSRIGRYKWLMLLGGFILLLGVFLLSRMTVDVTYGRVVLYMVICGLGAGPSFPLYTLAIQNAVDIRKVGQVTSASQFFRQIGSTVGAALLGTVLASTLSAAFNNSNLPIAGAATGGESRIAATGTGNIESSIRAQFAEQFALIEKVIKNNDQEALKTLMANPNIPEEFKAQLSAPASLGSSDLFAQIKTALEAEDLTALTEVLASSPIPAPGQSAIVQQATATFGDAAAKEAFLTETQTRLASFGLGSQAPDPDQLLATIKTQLDSQANSLITELTTTLREAFTKGVTTIYKYLVVIVAIGIVATFFVPELELRTSNAPMPAEV
jgi:MFS family permease